MTPMESLEESNNELKRILRKHGKEKCPKCQHEIGWGDIAWNNGSTEAGTECSTVEIQCEGCFEEIAHVTSWSWVEGTDDLLEVLDCDWE